MGKRTWTLHADPTLLRMLRKDRLPMWICSPLAWVSSGLRVWTSGGTYARRSATIFFATGGGEGERVSPTGVTSTFASG